jgi:hypothetical protein
MGDNEIISSGNDCRAALPCLRLLRYHATTAELHRRHFHRYVNAMSIADDRNGVSHTEADQTRDYTPHVIQKAAPKSIQASRNQKAILNDAALSSRLVLCFMAIHFLLAYCELILVAPLMKLFEQSLCTVYYGGRDPSVVGPGGSIPELLCKIQEVQAPLATIRGWKSMFDTIPGQKMFLLL